MPDFFVLLSEKYISFFIKPEENVLKKLMQNGFSL